MQWYYMLYSLLDIYMPWLTNISKTWLTMIMKKVRLYISVGKSTVHRPKAVLLVEVIL